jgi:peptidoglycan/LPS O-acetylase OafA/YrhL
MQIDSPRDLGHIPALDGVRAFAVLSVLGVHLDWIVTGAGVTLFFALSGFLISSLLMAEYDRTGTIRFLRFTARRALRLVPAVGAFLIVGCTYAAVTLPPWDRKAFFAAAAATLFYSNNWVIGLRLLPDNLLNHTWSLSVEEQFYILWPVALPWLMRRFRQPRSLAIALAALALLAAGERVLLSQWPATDPIAREYRIYNGTDTRADGLLLGAAAAVLFRYRRCGGRWLSFAGACSFFMLLGHLYLNLFAEPRSLTISYQLSHLWASAASALLVWGLAEGRLTWLAAVFSLPPIRYIGKLSYSLYLWHYPVFHAVKASLPEQEPLFVVGVQVLAGFLAAILSYHLVEKPFLKLKDRLK